MLKIPDKERKKVQVILVFVKYPEAGKVKTRIGKRIGEEQAAHLYQGLAESVFRLLLPLRSQYRILVCHDPPEAQACFRAWLGTPWEYIAQQGQTLGEKLIHAFTHAFQTPETASAIALGTDCPTLTTKIIHEAFEHLRSYPLVLGPALDGGYYLIGMNAFHPHLFSYVDWSTPRVLNQTLQRAAESQLTAFLLPPLADVDTVEDIPQSIEFSSSLPLPM